MIASSGARSRHCAKEGSNDVIRLSYMIHYLYMSGCTCANETQIALHNYYFKSFRNVSSAGDDGSIDHSFTHFSYLYIFHIKRVWT